MQVSGSDTSEDEARADWVDLRGLGQGHYCGYLQKKSRRDSSLWRRRWCILAVRGEGRDGKWSWNKKRRAYRLSRVYFVRDVVLKFYLTFVSLSVVMLQLSDSQSLVPAATSTRGVCFSFPLDASACRVALMQLRRWCLVQDDRLWLLRSKSEQSGRRRGGGRSHSFSLYLVPCVARAVSRPTVSCCC